MNTFTVTYTYKWKLDFADHYVFTSCGKCMNLRTGRLIKKVYNSGCIGYNIKGKFFSLTKLKKHLKKVDKLNNFEMQIHNLNLRLNKSCL